MDQAEQDEICQCATDRWMKDSGLGEVLTGDDPSVIRTR